MPRARRHARFPKRAESRPPTRRLKRRRLLLEPLEPRRLLAHLELPAIADGLVADRDLDGTFETAVEGNASILDRWFTNAEIGQERGVFEFDLTGIATGATVSAAKIGLDFTSRATSPDPGLVFQSYSGDGTITVADGDAASAPAATATVPGLGYREFTLDTAVIQSHLGGYLGIRLQNTELSGSWASLASIEDSSNSDPTLILDIEPAALTASIQNDSISEAGGTGATTALVTRTGNLSEPLTVTLSSSDTSEATVSSKTTIPAPATIC